MKIVKILTLGMFLDGFFKSEFMKAKLEVIEVKKMNNKGNAATIPIGFSGCEKIVRSKSRVNGDMTNPEKIKIPNIPSRIIVKYISDFIATF